MEAETKTFMNNPQDTSSISSVYAELVNYFLPFTGDGICIAYSGGVDSTLLLRAAVDAVHQATLQNTADPSASHDLTTESVQKIILSSSDSDQPHKIQPVLAVILETQLHPHSDTEHACRMASSLGAEYAVIHVDEFQDPQLLNNPVNRCYLCKRFLFSQLKEYAHAHGYLALFDGTNKDDEKEYRPGRQALKELQIKSPLLELGITKAKVRELSREQNLSTASVPSTPCLATRLPYGARLDQKILQRIHQGEQFLREMGFYNVRLRYHEPILRLEIDVDSFDKILKRKSEILSALKALEFPYITLDLEGFRSGSMDFFLPSNTASEH